MLASCKELISVPQAIGLCLGMSSLYVAVLYLLPASIHSLPRDAPRQIVWRSCAVAVATIASVAAVLYVTKNCSISNSSLRWNSGAIDFLGFRWASFTLAVSRPLLAVGLLYLGPLCTTALLAWVHTSSELVWRGRGYETVPRRVQQSYTSALWGVLADRNDGETKYTIARNLFVGPIFEEVVFRGCSCPLLLCAGGSVQQVVWGAPLLFGWAHLHHFFERRRSMGWQQALLSVLVQFAYTYLFGAFSAFLLLRTGHLSAPVVCHIFCNYWQLPDMSFMAPIGSQLSCLHPWRYFLIVAYVVGIGGFANGLAPLTSNAAYGTLVERWPCVTEIMSQ